MPIVLQKVSFFLILAMIACAQTSENKRLPPSLVGLDELKAAVMELDADSVMRYGNLAISVKAVKNRQVLLEQNAQQAMIIASNMKLVTTLTALEILGPDFQFKTELQYDGTLTDGTLNGNLYIQGGGDPTLGSDRVDGSLELDALMALWVAQIQKAGIRRINGHIIADDEFFNENVIPNGWTWSDIGNYYGAAAFGLNINDNLYTLYFEPGKSVGSATRLIRSEPNMQDITFVNQVTTGPYGSGDQSYIYGAPYTYYRVMQGTIPLGKTFVVRGSLPDPPLFTAQKLRNALAIKAIPITKTATSMRILRQQKLYKPTTRIRFYTHLSPTLDKIVEQTNLRSMNLYAETLLKMMGVKKTDKSTAWESSQAVAEFWEKKNLNMGGFFMRDGSGLSRSNSVTAGFMTDLLVFAADKPYFEPFYRSLPIAGISGTMKSLGSGTAAEGNLRAKTGTLDRVSSYSGYFRTKSGELMAFSLIFNDFSGRDKDFRKKAEKILVLLPQLP